MNNRHKKLFYMLIASSVLMFASIFTMSYKLLGIGLLQWVVVLFLAFNSTILKRFSFSDFSEYNYKVMRESWKDKKLVRTATYAMAAPLVLVGLSFVVMMIAVLIIFG